MSVDIPTGCAHGAAAKRVRNRPGLSEIAHGIGTQPELLDAMLARISAEPRLARLRTRAPDDPAIALVDAWAMVLDILSFYQARIANEGYLGTATEAQSVQELARAIGYELNPGVAATTHLAFRVRAAPGSGPVYPLPAGLKVQSIPGPDESPQVFETMEPVPARESWNEIRPRLSAPQVIDQRTTAVWLAGTATDLKKGDVILLVGRRRQSNPFSERWDARTVHAVQVDAARGITRVAWAQDLGHSSPPMAPADDPEIHVFDRRAALFGANAPDYRAMPESVRSEFGGGSAQWAGFEIQTVAERRIELDAEYADILPRSWVMLDRPGYRELYRVEHVGSRGRADWTLTGKVTSLTFDTSNHLSFFGLRATTVFCASRALPRAPAPVVAPVHGDRLELDGAHPDLAPGRSVILRGRAVQALEVLPRRRLVRSGADVLDVTDPPLAFGLDAGGPPQPLEAGERLVLRAPPEEAGGGALVWPVIRAGGAEGTVTGVPGEDLEVLPPEPEEDPYAPPDEALYRSERAVIRDVSHGEGLTTLTFEAPLQAVYWRASVTLNANVARATHGETRTEITSALTGQSFTETLGSGDASRSMQRFRLSQAPLTHVSAATPSGGASTLTVRVDGVQWHEVSTLYGQASDARVYAVRRDADGHAVVEFGDGRHGARLPSGSGNVTATYRVGIGLEGEVRAGQLALPMGQPLGLESVVNPLPATGAQDPEEVEAARANAPLTVLTFERIVSARDFEDFARAFAGIGKASATPVWDGERQVMHITVVGADGARIATDAPLMDNLRRAVDRARHPGRPVILAGHDERRFGLRLAAAVDPDLEPGPVIAALRAHLETRYGLTRQSLGDSVEVSRLMAGAQRVPGVVAVVLTEIDGAPATGVIRLPGRRARWDAATGALRPAELLLIDSDRLIIEEMVS